MNIVLLTGRHTISICSKVIPDVDVSNHHYLGTLKCCIEYIETSKLQPKSSSLGPETKHGWDSGAQYYVWTTGVEQVVSADGLIR